MYDIDFNCTDPQVIAHPEYKELIPRLLEGLKPYHLKDHFILFSSGTTGGDLKGYALSKKGLFANAQATINHFGLTSEDIWGLSLPVYHVGGLSVVARAHLLKNKIVDVRKWDPETWTQKLAEATITTIVPTQLYDLVSRKISAPKTLRYLIVGGDLLSSELESRALKLKWPVIRTFGMTEVCSQLASAKKSGSPDLEIFPLHQVKTDKDQRLWVKGSALFTLQFTLSEDLKVTLLKDLCDDQGFYKTNDKVRLEDKNLIHLGRVGDEIKIAGHLVNLIDLKNKLSGFLLSHNLYNRMEFSLESDERKGHKLVLLTLPEGKDLVHQVSDLVLPVKIDEFRIVENFQRTALGKLKKTFFV